MKIYHIADNGYKYDKRIFWGLITVMILLAFLVAKDYNYNFRTQFYFKCEKDSCENPLMDEKLTIKNTYTGYDYKKSCVGDWCTKKYLEYGEYGIKPPDSFIFNNFSLICVLLCIASLGLNHLIHNRGKKFGVKLNIPDKWLEKLEKISKKFDKLEE